MTDPSEERAERIEAAAAAEQALIEEELKAERTLARAEARLDKIVEQFRRLEREVTERSEKVEEARAKLKAVQQRRSDGPG